jgi:hypothetical protein
MAVEVHIARPVLGTFLERALQQQLRAACFPAFGGFWVDHLDVVPGTAQFSPGSGGVDVKMRVDAFIAAEAAVLATPNATPPTITVPGTLTLRMTTTGTVASLQVVDADLVGNPFPGLGPLRTALVQRLSTPITLDLTQSLGALRLLEFERTAVELTSETVAVRFDPVAAVRNRLAPGQEWGIHLDRPALEKFANNSTPDLGRLPKVTSVRSAARWNPEGSRPRIDLEFSGKAAVPDPLAGDFEGVVRLRLGLAPTIAPVLQVDLDFGIHFDLGGAVPSAIDDLVSEIVEGFAAAMIDPAKFGGVRTSPSSFRRDVVLPTLELGPRVEGIATQLLWKSLIATPDGLFLGGPVRLLSDPGRDLLGFGVNAFGVPHGEVLASDRGCVFGWQGDPPNDLWVTGSVSLGGGTLCGFALLPPHEGLSPYVEVEDWSAEAHTVRLKLPLAVSRTVAAPVRMLVRGSRGVRLADLGRPKSEDEAEVAYIDDCLYADAQWIALQAYEQWHNLWDMFPEIRPYLGPPPDYPFPDNPLDDPDPEVDVPGLYVKLIEIDDWEAGELVRVRTATATVDVTVDQAGRVMIPAIVIGTVRTQPVGLERVTRQATTGTRSRTAVFTRQFSMQGGTVGNSLVVDAAGAMMVRAEFEDRTDLFEIAADTVPVQVAARSQDAPPARAGAESPVYADLPGLVETLAVPGFEDAAVAIAVLEDGTQLVLNRAADGSTRVAGTYSGRFPRVQVDGDWAVTTSGGRVTVLRRNSGGAIGQ